MEIETEKKSTQIIVGKRQSCQIEQLVNLNLLNVSKKKVKTNDYHLNHAEKSFIYLHSLLNSEPSHVSKDLGRDKRTVVKFIEKVNSQGSFEHSHKRKGRWRRNCGKLNSRQKNILQEWLKQGKVKSSREAWLRITQVKNLPCVSYNTVNSYFKSIGGFVKPLLKTEVSSTNLHKRIKYCTKYRNFNFRKVLFSDESMFQINANNFRAFKFKGQKRPIKVKKNPDFKIMVWAGVCYEGKTSLHFVTETLKNEGYLKILKARRREILRLFDNRVIWYFQQDGAPCHRPRRITNYIKRYLTKRILPHPPQSPDLNPIELIWAQMKAKVERRKPQTKQQLKEAIQESWNSIKKNDVRKCIDDLKKKMDKILANKGSLL